MALLATRLPETCERRVWAMGGGPFLPYLRDQGVAVIVCDRHSRFDVSPAASLWHELRSRRPDVVHSWSWMSALAAGPMCRSLRIPHVDNMIQTGALEPDFTPLKRLGMACATLVVANTQAGLRAWEIDSAKGRVVYNGFDQSRLTTAEEGLRLPGTRFTVVMTGRMVPVKHYDVVIEAARRLSRRSSDWRFVLVGDGCDRKRLMFEARELADAGTVVFPEPGREVLGLVRQADAGVLMTNPRLAREGLSNSIMEYMALGLPVVCGDGGGNPELVLDGVTGFIVPPADPGALAERLQYLRDHEVERELMGAAGRARILGEFSVGTMVNRMLRVYAEAMEG